LPRRRTLSILLPVALPTFLWAAIPVQAADGVKVLDQISVTATREAQALVETPAAVASVDGETIRNDRPTHPAQIISQIPGAAVAVTNGEGHTTAIRQPFTTAPVYLFLEDGIPTRSTGFFNHNALYEINVPQSGGIEVTRGTGSALYGSDAVGGVINVLTRTPPAEPAADVVLEAGDFGWWRALVSAGTGSDSGGVRGDLNLTHTDGWRQKTAYDRQSGTVRWDHAIDEHSSLKTVAAFSEIDQETGANSPLVEADYQSNPTDNYLPIAYRKVSARRLSMAYEREVGDSLLSLTPYVRDNSMTLLASFRLRFDPTVSTSENQSFGLLAKWRQDFAPMRTRLVTGVDLDVSPGRREENRLGVTTTGAGATQRFIDSTVGPRIYDYDVTYQGVSPYVHLEASPTDRLRLTAGLRYDHMSYDFENNLAPGALQVTTTNVSNGTPSNVTSFYGQAANTEVSFHRASPKLGLTYALTPETHFFAAYREGFRAPSEGDLFRGSRGANANAANASIQASLALKPIRSQQFEVGVRGDAGKLAYDLVVYDLVKRDDLVSVRDPVTTFTTPTNAGKTRHRGIEIGLGLPLGAAFKVDSALSWAKHTYEEWNAVVGTTNTSFSGKEIETAPRVMTNTRLTWQPADATRVQLEWVHLGSYWLDQANTAKYAGHDLFNLRGNYMLTKHYGVFASVHNLADERYADSASLGAGAVPVYSPGLPRTLFAGVEGHW
jgi:outer membrane receptor protein involved in Fe transport